MARPAKAIDTQSRHNTKEEIKERKEVEKKLKGNADKVKPPRNLSENQKKIFKHIVKELEASEILNNLDVYVLTSAARAIDRLEYLESEIEKEPTLLFSKDVMKAKAEYTKDFFRCCNELSLSPQARAKIGSLSLQKKKEESSPLLKVLRGEGK